MSNKLNIVQLSNKSKLGWPWDNNFYSKSDSNTSILPKISIITPSFNQGIYIEETIRSVILQNYPNLEYIIIDGGSTDETVEIIKKYEPWLTYWVSEKDKGQSHAINKGLERCTGEIIAWINSDDFYLENTFFDVAEAYIGNPNKMIVGNVINFDDKGSEELIVQKNLYFENMISLKKYQSGHQPGMFFPAKVIEKVGHVDENLHFLFDLEWILRILKETQTIYLNRVVSKFRLHNESKTVSKWELWEKEIAFVRRKYINSVKGVDEKYVDAILLIGKANSLDFHNQGSFWGNLNFILKAFYISPKIIFTSYYKRALLKAIIPRYFIEYIKKKRLQFLDF